MGFVVSWGLIFFFIFPYEPPGYYRAQPTCRSVEAPIVGGTAVARVDMAFSHVVQILCHAIGAVDVANTGSPSCSVGDVGSKP
ncbi:hypothetical protein GGR55DRAFT_7401 [Xylaria sp. FL0064]|nr:hypothetical protein GGR55DRAFT_7401 [Xylaria sp. FL0064]